MPSDPSVAMIRSLTAHLDEEDGVSPWTTRALVIELNDTTVDGTFGYVYGDGPVAVAPDPRGIEPAVADYLAAYCQPGDSLPLSMLVQLDRTTGKYEITPEHADPSRWQVTPANIDTICEELRPHLV